MLRSETQADPRLFIACLAVGSNEDGVYPKMSEIDGPHDLVYKGNAHVEAEQVGIKQSCSRMHPDDPRDCVPCAVEEGTAVMIQWPHMIDWIDCSRRCQPDTIDPECITHQRTRIHALHKMLGAYLEGRDATDDYPTVEDVWLLINQYVPELAIQEDRSLPAEEPLADWERQLLQDPPEVGDKVRLTVTGIVDRRKDPRVEGLPTIYRIDTEPMTGFSGQWINVQHGQDPQVTLVTIEKKEN